MRLMSPEQPHLTHAVQARRWWLPLAAAILLTQPVFADPPTVGTPTINPNSVSPGAQVTLGVAAGGKPPLSYQWRFKGEDIVGATNRTLVLNPVQLSDAGEYSVVVRNAEGEQTSPTALLIVDPTFTKITTGDLVNTPCPVNDWGQAYWADYDGDGSVDVSLHLVEKSESPGAATNHVFHNQGDGTFVRVMDHPLAQLANLVASVAWADYDDDGDLDLLCNFATSPHISQPLGGSSRIYRNDGAGTFMAIDLFTHAAGFGPETAEWVDVDGDGWLDVFVGRYAFTSGFGTTTNLLFRNRRNGTFDPVTTRGSTGQFQLPARDAYTSVSWGDYDNDGWLDFAITSYGGTLLFRNTGDGNFTRLTTGSPGNDAANTTCCSWVDVNNDGFLDLFAAGHGNNSDKTQRLYLTNPTTNHWLVVRPVGTASSRTPVGAKIRVLATPTLHPKRKTNMLSFYCLFVFWTRQFQAASPRV